LIWVRTPSFKFCELSIRRIINKSGKSAINGTAISQQSTAANGHDQTLFTAFMVETRSKAGEFFAPLLPTTENKFAKARQKRAKGLHSAHDSTTQPAPRAADRSSQRLSALHRQALQITACLANPGPMLLSGFLMPAI
jgi:hypothetical protein